MNRVFYFNKLKTQTKLIIFLFTLIILFGFNLSKVFASLGGVRFVAVGTGTNTLAYSDDGITWTGLGTSIFSGNGFGIAWNGTRFVAVGFGSTNTIAYSADGITWTGLGKSIFSTAGRGVAWNGTRFVAVGTGTNTIAYSSDGITWTGLGSSIFNNSGYGIAWNGTRFVAVGYGTNSIAYSADGITWTEVTGTSIFGWGGSGITWNGTRFVAVGSGFGSTNTIAYSADGISWTGLGTSIFNNAGYGIAWNGTRFVAVGNNTNMIAYSADGITWTGLGSSIFLGGTGWGVAWNGTRFVAAGQGANTLAYSADGITWTGLGSSIFSTDGRSVGSAPAPNLVPAQPGMPMSGTLTPTSSSCVITLGQSSCNKTLTWTTTNPVGTSAVTAVEMSDVNGNGGSQDFDVPYPSRTFYLYNNGFLLAQSTITSSCSGGTTWNGGICASNVNGGTTLSCSEIKPIATAVISLSPNSIYTGHYSILSWSSTNATSCTGTNFSTGGATSGSVSVVPASSIIYTVTCNGATAATVSTTLNIKKRPTFIEN